MSLSSLNDWQEVTLLFGCKRTGKLGMILLACSAFAALPWWYSIGYLFLTWYLSHQISYFAFSVLMFSPLAALNVAGLVLYFRGRKTFWKTDRKERVLSTVIGSILVFLGSLLSWFHYSMSLYASAKHGPPWDQSLGYILAEASPYFVLSAFWLVSGAILLAHAIFMKTQA
jgi:hypothetical protein